MTAVKWFAGWVLAACAIATPAQTTADLTAAEIVARNATARGGADAWRRIGSMAWAGHVESANARGQNLPFLLEQQRPNKARFEIVAEGQKSVRAYDGTTGWKLRAAPGQRPAIESYSADELDFARGAQVIDGPLMDYAAKGASIVVAGVDQVAGRRAYVVEARLPSGGLDRIWVDAETFLELRFDRHYRSASGEPAVSSIFYGEYRAFDGLLLPVTIETAAVAGRAGNKLVIERVALNPALGDAQFSRPTPTARRPGAVVVDARSSPGAGPSPAPAPR